MATPTNAAAPAAKTPPTNAAAPAAKPVDEKKAARRANIKAAKTFLRKHLSDKLPTDAKEAATLFGQVQKALSIVIGTGLSGGGSTSGGGILDKIREVFKANAVVDEMELFKVTRMGRNEMRKRTRQLIRDVAPEDRMWITFDDKTESWTLKGTGENAPADWDGFKLIEKAPAE